MATRNQQQEKPPCDTPCLQGADILQGALLLFVTAYGAEGQRIFPHATPSHICFRTQTAAEQAFIAAMAAPLGAPYTSGAPEKPVHWVRLFEPLGADAARFRWLEITGPKINPATNQPFMSGPQMLVYTNPQQEEPVLVPFFNTDKYSFRCQSLTPAEILGLGN